MSRIHEALIKAEQERLASERKDGLPPLQTNGGVSFNEESLIQPLTLVHGEQESPGSDRQGAVPQEGTEQVLFSNGEASTCAFSFQSVVSRSSERQWKPDSKCVLFIDSPSNKLGEEEFRTLRSRLHELKQQQTLKKIVIASAMPGEGKTFVAVNLARAIAKQRGSRVLLIDSDLRSPRLHEVLGAPATPGLSDYLLGAVDEWAILQKSSAANLFFIPSGKQTSNPTELIASGRMKDILGHLAPCFDWVIIDSPPALPVSDASLIAQLSDGVLWVIKAGFSQFEPVQRALQSFPSRPLLGTVLNAVDQTTAYSCYSRQSPREINPAQKRV